MTGPYQNFKQQVQRTAAWQFGAFTVSSISEGKTLGIRRINCSSGAELLRYDSNQQHNKQAGVHVADVSIECGAAAATFSAEMKARQFSEQLGMHKATKKRSKYTIR